MGSGLALGTGLACCIPSRCPALPVRSGRRLPFQAVRSLSLSLALLCAVVAVVSSTATAASKAPVRVTFVGDSVPASISYAPLAQAELERGLRVRLDLRVCRRLVAPSCPYQGSTPSTALQAVQSYGRSLGAVLVVKVGYNESAQGYRQGIDQVMRAALAEGAKAVVWVTLRETNDSYHQTNVVIGTAAKRWPQLRVADWNAYSRGKPWFGPDGLHLTVTGAQGLATLVRASVLEAAASA